MTPPVEVVQRCPRCGLLLTGILAVDSVVDSARLKKAWEIVRCDCGVGEAQPGEMREHHYGCSLFIKDTDEWRAAHAALIADSAVDLRRSIGACLLGESLGDEAGVNVLTVANLLIEKLPSMGWSFIKRAPR